MKLMSCLLLCVGVLASTFTNAENLPSHHHEVYFAGTDYELNVYYVKGRHPGKTLLLIGGIQGDEPGGYLSADLYPDLQLDTGNLIVVPRANLKSIILGDRGPDGDMNRQFHDTATDGPMLKVVNKLKELMSQADLFLHLHDGWGYHSPVYIDSLRNPNRYGQALIADAQSYTCENGNKLDLADMAQEVLKEVNSQIDNKDYYLHFFNTRTADPNTPYSDMRKTATYYALRKECLPAFGVEASKNLPELNDKIRFHNLVINAFMKRLGIVPETPQILIQSSALHYAVFDINGNTEMIKGDDTLYVHRGDKVKIQKVGSDYNRGVTVDFLGLGGLNDGFNTFTMNTDTQVVFRKEGQKFGGINIRALDDNAFKAQTTKASQHSRAGNNRVFVLKVNGKNTALMNGQTLEVRNGDSLELISSFSDGSNDHGISINLRGWIPETPAHHDDRGYLITVNDAQMLKQYSDQGKGLIYPLVAQDDAGHFVGSAWIKILH